MNDRDEIDSKTRAMLADTPAQNWEEARRRLVVVRRYLRGAERTAAAADECAAEIGIRRSLFYRLARAYAGATGREAPYGRQPADEADEDTALAIVRAGPSASPAQIYRTVVQLRREQGLSVPSKRAVRTSCAKLLAGRSVCARLGIEADFAVDRAMLDLDLDTGSGEPVQCQLVCLVDLRRGVIVRHLLSAGDPDDARTRSLMDGGIPLGSIIAVSESDLVTASDHMRSAITQGGFAMLNGRWLRGTVIRSAVGLRLGRLALHARPSESDGSRPLASIDTARAVIDELVGRHRKTVG